jgi:hypothetical protein
MGTTRHFHVVFDVRVLDLNLSIVNSKLKIIRQCQISVFNNVLLGALSKIIKIY